MKRTKLSWLVIGVGAIAVASIVNSLEWRPSPQQAMAQVFSRDEDDRPGTDVKAGSTIDAESPNPGNPKGARGKARTLHPTGGVSGRRPASTDADNPEWSSPAANRSRLPDGARIRRIARPVNENGKTRIVYEEIAEVDPHWNKRVELNGAIRSAVDAFRTTEDAESRKALEAELSKSLAELFDLQQTEREEQLKPMEERVKKLRETLNKRAALRDDLIQLRLKVMLQDAEGLGWGTDDEFLPRAMSGAGLTPTYSAPPDEEFPTVPYGSPTTSLPYGSPAKSRPANKPQPRDDSVLDETPASVPSP